MLQSFIDVVCFIGMFWETSVLLRSLPPYFPSQALYVVDPLLEYDSWLTVGLTEGDPDSQLSEVENEASVHSFDAWGAVDNQVCVLPTP